MESLNQYERRIKRQAKAARRRDLINSAIEFGGALLFFVSLFALCAVIAAAAAK